MRLSLDTHIYLWALADDRRLPGGVRQAIADPDTEVYVSAACIWEVSIKVGLGRLSADPAQVARAIEGSGFVELPISAAHAAAVERLPPIHRDPFDRILVAQASIEGLTLVTVDTALKHYPGVQLLPSR